MRPWIILGLIILAFAIVELPGLTHLEPGDEWIYYAASKQLSQGILPYRDFFFAHPPMQLLFYLIPSWLEATLLGYKLIPFLSTLWTGVLVFLLAKRFGQRAGLIGSLLFFTSQSVLLQATYGVGVIEAMFLTMLGLYLLTRRKIFFGGIALGFAALTRSYALIPAVIILSLYYIKHRKENAGWHAAAGFGASYILPFIILVAVNGASFIDPVVRYHLLKPGGTSNSFSVLGNVLLNNAPLFIGALLAFLHQKRKRLLLFAVPAAAYILFLVMLNRIFSFYFVLAMPFLAILAGASISGIVQRFRQAFFLLLVIIIALSAIPIHHLWSFDFVPWETRRIISPIDGPVFGNDDTATLISLQQHVPLCRGIVDTNHMRYIAGLASVEESLGVIGDASCPWLVLRPLQGFGSIPGVLSYAQEHCILHDRADDKLHGTFLLFRCG
ncbi:MAG: hypothetical protein ABIH34_00030 [Nanoarchaeota archaeon]